jgi:hypothetical protein
MAALPPSQVASVAAENLHGAFHSGHADAVVKRLAAFAALACASRLRLNCAVPGNAMVTTFIQARGINRTNRPLRARVPVLAIGPVVSQDGQLADLAKRHLLLGGRRIPPHSTVAAIESAGAAVVWSAVGQESSSMTTILQNPQLSTQISLINSGHSSPRSLLADVRLSQPVLMRAPLL